LWKKRERGCTDGDLGRWLEDGNIEFFGAERRSGKDTRISHRVGRDRSAVRGHAGVGEAVVVAREDQPGEEAVVAYYTSLEGGRWGGKGCGVI